jgi:hypothetical protein
MRITGGAGLRRLTYYEWQKAFYCPHKIYWSSLCVEFFNENKVRCESLPKSKVIIIKYFNFKVENVIILVVIRNGIQSLLQWLTKAFSAFAKISLLIQLFWPNIQFKWDLKSIVIIIENMDNSQAKCHNIRFYEEFREILKCVIFINRSIGKMSDPGRVGLIERFKSLSFFFDPVDN